MLVTRNVHPLEKPRCKWLTRFRCVAALLMGAGLFGGPARTRAAEAPAPTPARIYDAVRLSGPAPVIDGRLDDACWKIQGTWSGDFTQREPHERAKPSLPTEVKVLYDDHAVYVAIRAYDPQIANKPRTLGTRDEFTGDMVGINFDSYHDRRLGYEFDVTLGGSKIDLLLRNDGTADVSWNAVWEVKTAVEPGAWTAEFRIPLSQLRYIAGKEQIWGMHCWRWIAELQEESDWNLIPMDHHGFLYSFGELRGLKDLPASRRFEIAPYAIARVHRYEPESGNPYRRGHDNKLDGGLDLKYGLGTNLTIDATINPDFSQVDADPSEINLTTVETFQEERRPFFLEGKDTFEFGFDDDHVFYTRRIGDAPRLAAPDDQAHEVPDANRILASAKLTGTTAQGLSVGLLQSMVDRNTVRVVTPEGERRLVVEPAANDSILRLQQEFQGGDLRIGTIFTGCVRDGSDADLQTLPRRAFAVGADGGQYFSHRDYLVEGRVLWTEIAGTPQAITALQEDPVHNFQRPDAGYIEVDPRATHLYGNGGYVRAGRVAGLWRASGFVSWRSPGVEFNDLGYLQSADFVQPGVQFQYYDASSGAFLRRRDVRLKISDFRSYGGEHLGNSAYLQAELATMSGAYLWAGLGANLSSLNKGVLRGGPALRMPNSFPFDFYAETPGGRVVQFNMHGRASTSAEADRLDWRAGPGVEWKPVDRVKIAFSLDYQHNIRPTQYAGTTVDNLPPQYLMGKLDQELLAGTFRLAINFTPSISLSYYGGPFVSTGRYTDFKWVTHPRAESLNDRFEPANFSLTPSGQIAGQFQGQERLLDNPDFNWREFKSNLVFKWEYRPGSFAYLVWSQYRSDSADIGGFSPEPQYNRLFSVHPDNTVMVKISYWFSI